MLNWNYKGIFPNGAESHGNFWGYKGIRSYTGNPYPKGLLYGATSVVTPSSHVITCIAVNTTKYSWQKSDDGTSWADIPDEFGSTLTTSYVLGQHGTYHYRCICHGLLGDFTTGAFDLTVTEPSVSVVISSTKSSIVIGEEAVITCFITPYESYAKSFKWQSSTDGTTWNDIAESTLEHHFTGETAGTTHFRVIATQYDDVEVTSNELPIEVTEPPTP